MHITLLQENLLKQLKVVQRAIARKAQLPILSTILLEVTDTSLLKMTATDLFIGVETSVQGDEGVAGKWAVPGKQLVDIVQSLRPGKIMLSVKDSVLTVATDRSTSTISVLDPQEFPSFPDLKAEKITVTLAEIDSIIDMVGFAASTDETRPVLTSVLFEPLSDSKVDIVATDGFRLAKKESPIAFSDTSLLLPAKALKEVQQVAKQLGIDSLELVVDTDQKQVAAMIGSTSLYLRVLDGQFPPYQKIIPSSFEITGTIDSQELQQALKACQVFARDSSNIVTLELSPQNITVSATSPTYGSHSSTILWVGNSDKTGIVAFNITYVLDFIQHIKAETIWLGMNDSLQPILLRPNQVDSHSYLVMPFKLNQ